MILQKYDFSSKSQQLFNTSLWNEGCLWYCKSTIFQANHNRISALRRIDCAVCDTAKVRFFKQITTLYLLYVPLNKLFVILQKYDFSSKSQPHVLWSSNEWSCLWYCKSTIFQANHNCLCILSPPTSAVCDTAKVRFFKQITTTIRQGMAELGLFVILQKYDFSSKSQRSSIFFNSLSAVCDTAKVRFFKQITTIEVIYHSLLQLFVILQKYDFSSKSQPNLKYRNWLKGCLWYCKSTIFQANHNSHIMMDSSTYAVCDTAKVRFFKQITTNSTKSLWLFWLFVILQKYDFSSKSQQLGYA